MRREGCPRGLLKPTNPKLQLRSLDAPSPGSFAARAKPTNASKSGGKSRKASWPTTKSKDKAKGTHKSKGLDVALNHRLVSWRVVDGGGSGGIADCKGFSATAVLQYLSNHSFYQEEDDGSIISGFPYAASEATGIISGFPYAAPEAAVDLIQEVENSAEAVPAGSDNDNVEIQEVQVDANHGVEANDHEGEGEEDDEDDDMGFYVVGFAIEYSDGEDWLVVEEII